MGNIQNSLIGNQIGTDILLAGGMVAASNRAAADEISRSNDRQTQAQKETTKELAELKKSMEAQAAKQKADAEAYYKEYRSLTSIHLSSTTAETIDLVFEDDISTYRIIKYNQCQVIEKACNVGVEGNKVRILTLHDLYFNSYFDIRVDADSFYNVNENDIIYLDKNIHTDYAATDLQYFNSYLEYLPEKQAQEDLVYTKHCELGDVTNKLRTARRNYDQTVSEFKAIDTGNIIPSIIATTLTALFVVLSLVIKEVGIKMTFGLFGILLGAVSTACLVSFGCRVRRRPEYDRLVKKADKEGVIREELEKQYSDMKHKLAAEENKLSAMKSHLRSLRVQGITAFKESLNNENKQ